MENTSEQDAEIRNVYKDKLNILVSQNRSFFITGLIALVIIMYIFILQLGSQVITQLKNTISASVSRNFVSRDTEVRTNLSGKISNTSIDYISPSTTPSGNIIEENGQITAISSGQVTYTKNRYVVQKGDSLASIAQQVYGDRDAWVRIAEANNLASPDLIEIGMELVIPR